MFGAEEEAGWTMDGQMGVLVGHDLGLEESRVVDISDGRNPSFEGLLRLIRFGWEVLCEFRARGYCSIGLR